jgi:hypothetical protein
VLTLLNFHLWAFFIPSHIYATYVAKKTGRHPWYPYVINVLMGLLLSMANNPIYYLLGGSGRPNY